MKKIFLSLFAGVLLTACSEAKSLKVEVENPSALDRTNEMVEVDWKILSEKLALDASKTFIVENAEGKQVPYQIITQGTDAPQSVIFQADLKPRAKAVYTFKTGTPDAYMAKVYGRHVPERKDDFAWENDRIAFRMYGPALAKEYPSNGVDIWLKRTDSLVLDQFYSDELERGLSYHADRGHGLDCYKVGHTLGAGGIAPYYQDSLWVGNHYDSFQVLDSGPLRVSFVLNYSIPVAGETVKQTLTVSLDANSQLSKGIVACETQLNQMDLAAGIFLHKVLGDVKTGKDAGYIAYAENAVSDFGLDSGRDYVGVIFPQNKMKEIKQNDTHLLALTEYKPGEVFVYYFGAGWNKWGFETNEDWFKYMEDYALKVNNPLTVKILE